MGFGLQDQGFEFSFFCSGFRALGFTLEAVRHSFRPRAGPLARSPARRRSPPRGSGLTLGISAWKLET